MSSIVHFPNSRKIREEACAWIARIDAGLSDMDKAALDEWLAASLDNRQALLELSELWDEMDLMSELAGLLPLKQPQPESARGQRSVPRFCWIAGAAACSIVLLGVWLLPVGGLSRVSIPVLASSFDRYETDVGQQATVPLDDGSVLTLNTNTRLRVHYTGSSRSVVLERGEASFDVAHDAARPFAVYAGRQVVQAIGTVFNVYLTRTNEIEVAVTEGRVRVLHRPEPVSPRGRRDFPIADASEALVVDSVVSAGQAVVIEDSISTLKRLEPEDIDVELAWQRGMLIFRGEPLETVLSEVARYTTVEFELTDEALASVRVGGYFRAGEVDGLLLALHENFNIQASRNGQTIVLRPN